MNCLAVLSILLLAVIVQGAYNPIPPGSVVVSTMSKVLVVKPVEYGGDDSLGVIYTAMSSMTIIHSVYNPTTRDLYILFTNDTSGTVLLGRLVSREQLDSTIYRLPITFNLAHLNKDSFFSSDVVNQRLFFTDEYGQITVVSMSGLMQTAIAQPSMLANQTRCASYANGLNVLIVATDSAISSCTNLDANKLVCCSGEQSVTKFHSITIDHSTGDVLIYFIDEKRGVFRTDLDSSGCPMYRFKYSLYDYSSIYLSVYLDIYVVSGSKGTYTNNSLLVIGNGTYTQRQISIGIPIVALHMSYPDALSVYATEETCFHGITFNSYRTAVILAAVFGTIMGIFMCFNALFCIDFFMTKSIIRELKKQIPHDLLEDRWNKLVEEKYAKIALEKQRITNDPPPKRVSSVYDRKPAPSATGTTLLNPSASNAPTTNVDLSLPPNSRQKITDFFRRKSDTYFSRRTDDYERHTDSLQHELSATAARPTRNQLTVPGLNMAPVSEDDGEQRRGLRQNLSGKELLKYDADFL